MQNILTSMCQRGHLQACDCTHLTHACQLQCDCTHLTHGTSFNDSHVWFSQAPHTNSCTLIRGYSACACKDRTAPILKCQRAGCRCQLQNLLLEKHTFDAACSCWRTMQRTYKCACTHTHVNISGAASSGIQDYTIRRHQLQLQASWLWEA